MKLLPVVVACAAAFVGSDHAAYAYNLFSKSTSSPEQQVRSATTSRRSLLSSAAAATTALLLGGSVEDQRGLLGARAALAVEEKAADVLTPLYFGVGVSSGWHFGRLGFHATFANNAMFCFTISFHCCG